MGVEFNLIFPHDYEVELGGDMLSSFGDTPVHYFPADKVNGQDGLILKVTPNDCGKPWFGIFAFGAHGGSGLNGVFSCPNNRFMCVVSSGRVYIIDSISVLEAIEASVTPVKSVIVAKEAQKLLFVDHTSISALGLGSTTWKTDRLAWDDVTITGFDQLYVWGEGFDPTNNIQPRSTFKVELATGKVVERSTWVPL